VSDNYSASSKFPLRGKPMRILRQQDIPADTAPRRRPRRSRAVVRPFIDWLRAGYSDEAPRTGHSPLIALNGPVALSDKQVQKVVGELGIERSDTTDIGVAISRATGCLPNVSQIRQVAGALEARRIKRSR
jgi:hypothetical protein